MKTDNVADDPWKVLELAPGAVTLAEVKRAYARLIKVNRPDQNAEGFMRLRAAYESAQNLLKGGQPPTPLPDAAVPPDSGAAPVSSTPSNAQAVPVKLSLELPVEVKEARESLRQAVASKVRQKVRIAWAAYDDVAERLGMSKESRWLLFIEIFASNIPLLADACTDERLLEHLKSGEMRLLRLVTDQWSRQADAKRLDEFCVSLSRQRQLAESENGSLAMVTAAIALGAWNPEQAARMAQRAFPRLPTDQRKELAEAVDFETMLGRLVGPLPQPFKIPWVEVLRHGDAQAPWNQIIRREMVVALLRYCGPQWAGLPILAQKLKPESWMEFKTLAESMLR